MVSNLDHDQRNRYANFRFLNNLKHLCNAETLRPISNSLGWCSNVLNSQILIQTYSLFLYMVRLCCSFLP